MTEAYFIQHCDSPDCDLGSFDYQCPSCGRCASDYEVWWELEYLYQGGITYFKCANCKEKLNVKYNKEEFQFEVDL